jgi:DNA replication protein DnaC
VCPYPKEICRSERHEQVSTIVTSNLDFADWGDVFPNRPLGATALDRLRHAAYRVILGGESYRSPRPLRESQKQQISWVLGF